MSERIDLSVNIGGLKLKNPVMLASGTVGYGNEISNFTDLSKIGAIVTKSVSLNPRKGNPPQRIVETPSGMLNAIGLANVGLESFINDEIPISQKHWDDSSRKKLDWALSLFGREGYIVNPPMFIISRCLKNCSQVWEAATTACSGRRGLH